MLKSNATGAMQLQCLNVSGSVVSNKALLILNTTYNNQSLYIPCNYIELGNVASGGVQIGDGTNAGATNLYGIVSLKNATDSTNYTSTNCSNVAGGLSVYKALNVGGNITASGSVNCTTANATNIYASGLINGLSIADTMSTTTWAIITAGGVGIAKSLTVGQNIGCNVLTCGSACNVGSLVSGGAISGTTITGTGALNIGTNGITCGAITSSGSINGTAITATGNINAYGNTIYGGGVISTGGISGTTITASTGLVLPTTGGTAATLNYYESNFNFPMMFQGAGGGGTNTTVNLTISRIGNIVNIIMPIVNINSNGSYITTNSSYYLPTRFRPSATYIEYCMHSMNIATYLETGMINVCATGCINICKSSSSVSFGVGTGSGTAKVFHMIYSV